MHLSWVFRLIYVAAPSYAHFNRLCFFGGKCEISTLYISPSWDTAAAPLYPAAVNQSQLAKQGKEGVGLNFSTESEWTHWASAWLKCPNSKLQPKSAQQKDTATTSKPSSSSPHMGLGSDTPVQPSQSFPWWSKVPHSCWLRSCLHITPGTMVPNRRTGVAVSQPVCGSPFCYMH